MKTKNGHEIKKGDILTHYNTGDFIKVADIRSDLLYYNDVFVADDGKIYEEKTKGMLTRSEAQKCIF